MCTQFFAVAENYPELKASENFLQLQRSLNETEEQLAAARRTYNASVTVEILPPEGQAVSTDPSDIDGASDDWSDNSIDGSSFTSGTASGWDDENSDTLDIIPNESQDDFSADAGSWESGDSGF